MGEYKALPLSQLKVNPQNPRYRNPRISESDAMLALFKEIKSRPETALRHMLNLIDDIVKYGTNPADLPIAVPDPDDNGMYQVMEGNRRIASLKLLYFPDLAAEVFRAESRVLKRLAGFRKDFLDQFQDQYKEVLCVVYPTPEDARHWLYLRHTGENEGRGTTPWDKAAKDRFRLQAAERKHTIATQVVGILSQEGYLEPDMPVVLSTVERMAKDPDVASQLHIEIAEGEVGLPSDHQLRHFALKVLQRIALDTVEKHPQTRRKRLTSRHINQKSERLRYLHQVISQVSPSLLASAPTGEDKTLAVEQMVTPPSDEQTTTPPMPDRTTVPVSVPSPLPSRPPATQDYRRRRQVAAKGIRVGHSVLDHLYRQELCELDADSYPNIGAIGIRVFLEGSLDVLIKQFASAPGFQGWMQNPKAPYSISLSAKLAGVTECLETNGLLPRDAAQAIRKYQSSKDNPLSLDTLQAYLHNPELEPRGETVRYWWDAYHPLFGALWNAYNATIKP